MFTCVDTERIDDIVVSLAAKDGIDRMKYKKHEIAPQNMRGGLGLVNQLLVTIGVLLAYVLCFFSAYI
ncbi:sugar transporter ERD6-like 6 [Senna tora]|uniref:Sugar transporter ERD6-like 6 n=1 Tax=Senna tora TaxID=362788 RepID=A0A834SZ22_9FABA|nr:sugar transporter ERD6-like 6 [Senna tora]